MSHYDYKYIIGQTWNLLFPKREVPPMPTIQPRDHAIRGLFDYLSLVEWRHEGRTEGEAITFSIPRARMYEEKPDDTTTLELPCLVVDPRPGSNADEPSPLGPPIVWENTYDGKTVLVEFGLYRETFNLEVWASNLVTRRAILAGMDIAFAPTGDFSGLNLSLPKYYDLWAWFGLDRTTRMDDAQVGGRRRYGICEVELWVPVVHRVPIGFFQPRVRVQVNNPDADETTPESLWDVCPELISEEDD